MDLESSDGLVLKSMLVWGKMLNIYFTNRDGDTLASPMIKFVLVSQILEFYKVLPETEVKKQSCIENNLVSHSKELNKP